MNTERPDNDDAAHGADALTIDVHLLTAPRPEDSSGHAESTPAVPGHPGLERLLSSLDTEFPAEESVEGDIHKAIAALNRALRRPRASGTAGGQAQKTGR